MSEEKKDLMESMESEAADEEVKVVAAEWIDDDGNPMTKEAVIEEINAEATAAAKVDETAADVETAEATAEKAAEAEETAEEVIEKAESPEASTAVTPETPMTAASAATATPAVSAAAATAATPAAAPAAPAAAASAAGADGSAPGKKKGKGIGKKILVGLAAIMLLFSTATSAVTLAGWISPFGEGDDSIFSGPTEEDGVVINDTYKIESTLAISDAYKSGDDSKLDEKEKEVLIAASAVIDEVIKDDMSDLEKEMAIYDWIRKNVAFDDGMMTVVNDTSISGTPYGALINKKAVCVGYATTFRLFMQMMDIECKVCHSTDRIHSWDLVKIDGHWYHVDIYSDVDSVAYAHFNLDDTLMGASQEWDREYFPAADSLEANPAYKDRVKAENVYEIPGLIKEAMQDRKGILMIEVKNDPTEDERAVVPTMVDAISSAVISNNPFGGIPFDSSWYGTGDMYMTDTECTGGPDVGSVEGETELKVESNVESDAQAEADARNQANQVQMDEMQTVEGDGTTAVSEDNPYRNVFIVSFMFYGNEGDEEGGETAPNTEVQDKADQALRDAFGDIDENISINDGYIY